MRLVALDAEAVAALSEGRPARVGDASISWPAEDSRVLRYRGEALSADPASAPYLLHVLLDGTTVAARIGGHTAPVDGLLEIGYFVAPAYRGRGVATEMLREFLAWSTARGVRRVRASVGPDNAPSLAVVRGLGFEQVGEQWDDEDGRELLFERELDGG